MKLDIIVRNRQLINSSTNRIPANNTTYLAFTFEPGYGWEDCEDITAVFTKNNERSFRVGIKNGVYYEIPQNMVTKAGNVFVSLKGSKGGVQTASTLTTCLTVEYQYLDQVDTVPYPKDECGNLDRDAYAQYVSTVTDAMNRAEAAAKSVESKAIGWYTRDEADERFAKRTDFKATITDKFDTSSLMAGSIPSVTIKGEDPIDLVPSTIGSPSPMTSIDAIRININSPKNSSVYTYAGFVLRRISNFIYDTLVVDKNGAKYKQNVYALKVKDVPGGWDNDTQYRISLVTCPTIDLSNVAAIKTNIGAANLYADYSNIILSLPAGTTIQELDQIEVWYPLAEPIVSTVSLTGLGAIPEDLASITVEKRINKSYVPLTTFDVSAELNVSEYISKFVQINQTLITKVDAFEEQIADANEAVGKCEELSVKVDSLMADVENANTNILNFAENVASINESINDVTAKFNVLEEHDKALEESISNNFDDLKLVKAGIEKLNIDYTELEKTALAHHAKLSAIDSDIVALKDSESKNSDSINKIKEGIQSVVETAIDAKDAAEAAKDAVALMDAKVENAKEDIAEAKSLAIEAKGASTTATEAANATALKLAAVTSEVEVVVSNIETITSNTEAATQVANEAKLVANETRSSLDTVKVKVEENTTNIKSVSDSVTAVSADVEETKETLATVSASIEETSAALKDAQEVLESVSADIDNIKENGASEELITKLDNLETLLTSLQERVESLEAVADVPKDGFVDVDNNVIVDEDGKPLSTTQVVQQLIQQIQLHSNDDSPMTIEIID